MNPAGEAVLVPPRPNPGPEPMPQRPSSEGLVLVVLLIAAGALNLIGLVHSFRKHRRRNRLRVESHGIPDGPFVARRDQMAAWSAAVRAALTARFGAYWSARTTEEIAADRSLAEALGPETAELLVRFLSDADRAKFDDREGLQPPLPGSAPEWLARFVSSSEPAAGARSMIKGK
ncbi:MAG: hypothetical protein QOE66_735 [Chloroflexota bacterium]|nr:hypothetical protein [Chloroflexota bacterium]